MATATKKIVLIDGHALVHRAFHALPPLANPSGVPTNAIFGFMSVTIKMLKDLKPDYVAAAFDLAGPTFRHEEFAEYKSHRVKAPDELHMQVPYIKEILTAFGVPIFEKPGFEADDLIGALAETAKAHDDVQVIIMTGDLDTLQLVEGDKVVVLTPRKGLTDTVTYNEKEVKARYGITPTQVIDFKGLKGDPSDNIPGVPGIGEITASGLIKAFGSLEDLYAYLEKNTGGKKKLKKPLTEKLAEKLLTNKDQAFFSKKLATIIRDVDIDFALEDAQWRVHMDRPKLEKTLKDLALYSILKRIDDIDAVPAAAPATLFDQPPAQPVFRDLVATPGEAAAKLEAIAVQKECVVYIQDNVIIFAHVGQDAFGFPATFLKDKKVFSIFKDILEGSIGKVAHDSKTLARWALEQGIAPVNFVFDAKLAAFVINSDIKDYTLPRLYFMEFGRDLDAEPLSRPAAICELRDRYTEKLAVGRLNEVYHDIELPLAPVLAGMEVRGILVDRDVVSELSIKVNKELAKLEKEIFGHAGGEFNINSPKQLSEVLFEKLEMKGKVRKTGKGVPSTAADELEKLIDEHPIVAQILKYRELQKLKTTYIEPLPLLIAADHRIHTTYNQAGATTGRLSSQDPNLQNIPIRTELGQEFRKAFVADKGKKLVSCDYSQLELRIAAHISGDPAMSEAFKRGEDIHTRTAAQVFRVKPEDVTKDMRRQAKVLNFGVLYGMGVNGFQRAAGVGRDEARAFIANYMQEFSGLAKYIEDTKALARKQGFVETVFGRRRAVPDINSTMPAVQAGAERVAVNMPVQGTAADLFKLAMINVQKMLEQKYEGKAAMLLQVHDELLFEIESAMVDEVAPQIQKIMESVHQFNVPIVADAKVGDNWSEMEEI